MCAEYAADCSWLLMEMFKRSNQIQDHSIWNRLHQSDRDYRKTMFTSELRFGTMPLNPYRKMPIIYGRQQTENR